MSRASVQIVIFLILLTAAANVITASGLGAALDINPDTQGEEAVDRVNETASEVEPSQGIRDTLFSLYTSVATVFDGIASIIFAAPIMFRNLGVPNWLTAFLFAGAVIIVAKDIIHVLTGRDL